MSLVRPVSMPNGGGYDTVSPPQVTKPAEPEPHMVSTDQSNQSTEPRTFADQVTIVSVSFQSAHYLRCNRLMMQQLDQNTADLRWIVVENSPPTCTDKLASDEPGFEVLPRVPYKPELRGAGSYHHGRALDSAMKHIDTPYVLVIDPDFFVISRNWLTRLIHHMQINDLAAFGAPWHPRWFTKWRLQPCCHFLLLARKMCDTSFSPAIHNQPKIDILTPPAFAGIEQEARDNGKYRAYRLAWARRQQLIESDLRLRRAIGSSKDTGYSIAQRLISDHKLHSEMLMPSWTSDPWQSLQPEPETMGPMEVRIRALLDRRYPEPLRFVPRRHGSFTARTFAQFQLPDVGQWDWESFFHGHEPFGFHVRPGKRDDQQRLADKQRIASVLTDCLKQRSVDTSHIDWPAPPEIT